nr:ABC transporter substrate-binding protein [Gammaproteobacteria bacterium]NIU07030.1 ABC transporter substrate-binding protein [Gammaproteobacteria bacterium]NIV76042.1 hypothetical protein [Gammaproteobacteria bacterium]NIX88303.1 hypothetical protein [Gammaproteobacteria bacterium]
MTAHAMNHAQANHRPLLPTLRLIVLAGALAAAASLQAAPAEPAQVVRETTEHLLDTVKARSETLRDDEAAMKQVIDEILMPVVDFPYFSRLVLGKYWRRADSEQRERFLERFRALLVKTYALQLVEFSDVGVSYKDAQLERDGTEAAVRVEIRPRDGKPVQVQYIMHLRDERWQVYDIIVEGISTVVTFRSTFY